eukprot:CAMPEP_0114515466 /NCGR_PEP_ID=MMETSP0109-20121206/16754_1 /TAXON_ID=29199 /ORGANISM="Chlorarachnion reptans, Strain CCCM449" /LENGTH=206 /DNA_ID=CAMNT_0001695679 /DNA_START=95 /DNA_END=715 /DNA_ORIENTATION=-
MSGRKKKRTTKGSETSGEMKACLDILKQVSSRGEAHPFKLPVDWKSLNIPDYPKIIKKPMDLFTIQQNLNSGVYGTPEEFAQDVRLVWKNAQTYNLPGSQIYKAASKLAKFFEKHFAKLNKKKPGPKRRRTDPKEVSRTDRVKFSNHVTYLSSEELGHIVDILKSKSPGAVNEDKNEIEIEINNIEASVLLELNQYAAQCKRARNK